jgi:hypothetical protein
LTSRSVQLSPGVKHTVNDRQLGGYPAPLGRATQSTSVVAMVQTMRLMHDRWVMGQNLRARSAAAWSLAGFWLAAVCVEMEYPLTCSSVDTRP